jgi:hypothetical protein
MGAWLTGVVDGGSQPGARNKSFAKQGYGLRLRFQEPLKPKLLLERFMGKRDEWIAKYAEDLKNKCGMDPDMDLLTKVTIGCGPSIYNADAQTVSAGDTAELNTVKDNFLIKKLGLPDDEHLMGGIQKVIETYGRSERNKYRAVVYYMLVKHFGKESVYG